MRAAAFVALLLSSMSARGAELTAEQVVQQTGIARGLFVVIDDAPHLAIDLAKRVPVLVHLVTKTQHTEAVRAAVVDSGLHGRVTVNSWDQRRLPLIDGLAAVVVVGGGSDKVDHNELLRVLRFDGKLVTWNDGKSHVIVKPRPDGVDDWPQYHHDGAASDYSHDLIAGPAHGIQWLAGRNSGQKGAKMGVRVVGSLIVQVDERGVVARDIGSGLPVWRRSDLAPKNRYAFLAGKEHLYLIPRTMETRSMPRWMQVLDLQTGKDVRPLEEGLPFGLAFAGLTDEVFKALEKSDRNAANKIREAAQKRYDSTLVRLGDGVLLQVADREMAALDAATGKRLWLKTLEESSDVIVPRRGIKKTVPHTWHHPIIADGRVFAIEGVVAPSYSYTHWPMGTVRTIHCFELKSGKPAWSWDWPRELGESSAAYNMLPAGKWIALMLRDQPQSKGKTGLLIVDKATGKSHKLSRTTPYAKSIGGGHSHARVLFAGGKLWVNGTTNPIGAVDLSDIENKDRWLADYARLHRPVGCTVTRATPNYVFGSLTTYELNGSGVQHTNAARSVCDVGATPAAGMTFITPTQCFCAPYLPGFKAFHSRKFEGPEEIDRLETGAAQPAPRSKASVDWPEYMSSAKRNLWSNTQLPRELKSLWTINLAEDKTSTSADGDHLDLRDEWRDNWYTQGPVTPVAVSEGVAVLALVDRQQVVAIDPATGAEHWRTTVDGRVDSTPTIRGGIVYCGTRNGWLYALNRDTGRMIWRFFAAPRRERLVCFGQLESRWPLPGSVLVQDDGVWAISGRHNDTDGGLWWWRLEPATGKRLASGRLGSDELSTVVGVRQRSDGDQSGANMPPVSDGKLLFLSGLHFEKKGGRLADHHLSSLSDGIHEHWESRFDYDIMVPGNQGLMHEHAQMGGYKMSYYGFTQSPAYAYRGRDFLHAGGTDKEEGRGGSAGGRYKQVTRFRKLDAIETRPHPRNPKAKIKVGAEKLWTADFREADQTGFGGFLVAGDAVLVGFSVDSRDRWRERKQMPCRLRSFDYQTGKRRQEDLALPAKPVLHGLSAAESRVYVACEDGSVVCLGQSSE